MTINLARTGHTLVLRVSVIIIFPITAAGNASPEDIVDRKGSERAPRRD
jgi:hypothetical protein